MSAGLTSWDTRVKEFEKTQKARLPEVVKLAALMAMMPREIQDMIFQRAETFTAVDVTKDKIMGWVNNRTAMMQSPTPMDVGYVDGAREQLHEGESRGECGESY